MFKIVLLSYKNVFLRAFLHEKWNFFSEFRVFQSSDFLLPRLIENGNFRVRNRDREETHFLLYQKGCIGVEKM